jgi:uncharacterized protein with HEPN domain
LSEEADAELVAEILDAIGRVKTYVEPEGRAGFLKQALVYDAVYLNLLRIGECARFLSDAIKARRPDIPWLDIVSLRNRVAHGYETLRPDVLWLIVSVSLPELDDALRGLGDL